MARTRFVRGFIGFCRSICIRYENLHAEHEWKRPRGFHADSVHEDMTRGLERLRSQRRSVEAWKGGTHAGLKRLKIFTGKLLERYDAQRNHPEMDGTSCLSPYLHFGHVGPMTIALAVDAAAKANPKLRAARDSYFNELIVWRELAVNFVRYTPNYDSPDCAESPGRRRRLPSMRGTSGSNLYAAPA